jgi:uncharacterized protein YfiM (DUF2279 family)
MEPFRVTTTDAGSWMRHWVLGTRPLQFGTLVVAAAIVILSLIPQGMLIDTPGSDKVHHFLAYALLTASATVAWPHRRSRIIGTVLIVLLGCALEIAQSAVPGRTPDLLDVAANIVGISIGTAVGWAFIHLVTRRPATDL